MRSKFRGKLFAAPATWEVEGDGLGGDPNSGTKKAPLSGAFLDLSNYKLDTKMNKTLIYPAEIDEARANAFKVQGEKCCFYFFIEQPVVVESLMQQPPSWPARNDSTAWGPPAGAIDPERAGLSL